MMDWTDRHCRYLHRLLSGQALLYTEMVTSPALVRGGALHLLDHDVSEHPVALQLGGSNPHELAAAAKIGAQAGYDEINLNVGCPSDRVQSGCFGAVLIELSEDIAKQETDLTPLEPRKFRRPGADDKIADHAWDLIKNAKRPVIIAGNGMIRKRASKQLRKFCDQTGIGVISTFMAKGCVDMNADYCLFTIGLQQKDYVSLAVDDADLVITLGYDLVEYPPRLWNVDGKKCIVHIDFLPAETDAQYMPEVEVVGDLAHALWMLNERVERDGLPKYELDHQRDVRKKMQEDFAAHADDETEGHIRPQKVLWDVRQALGPNDILFSGVGAHKMWIAR